MLDNNISIDLYSRHYGLLSNSWSGRAFYDSNIMRGFLTTLRTILIYILYIMISINSETAVYRPVNKNVNMGCS